MLLACNYMNEGCSGGFGIFHGYFAENGHLVSEECAPFKYTTFGDKCQNYEKCPAVARVNSSYYLGGYNFNPSVELMQKELLMNGPLITEINAEEKFSRYHGGILF